MVELGYALSSEEHRPSNLVKYAIAAEAVGFPFALISDHFHPWIDKQGQSSFVWSVLGAIAQNTTTLRIGTGVTCPTVRIHPAIIAQAAATVGDMMPGRFFLGVGTGENLNEHILGDRWPSAEVRLEMLEEAMEVIRQLWEGGNQSYSGAYFEVENARIYTLPEKLPEIMVAASGKNAARLAGTKGDGLILTSPNKETVQNFEEAGGLAKPKFGQVTVCWAKTEAEGRKTAFEWWPNTAIEGELGQELPLPRHFEQAARMVTEDDVAKKVTCGPDPKKHIKAIKEYVDAGCSHVYVHQVGPEQEGFLKFYEREVLPKFR
jgi:G6PDH family F420-dependent oxidoreductase